MCQAQIPSGPTARLRPPLVDPPLGVVVPAEDDAGSLRWLPSWSCKRLPPLGRRKRSGCAWEVCLLQNDDQTAHRIGWDEPASARRQPGEARDAIFDFARRGRGEAELTEIHEAVANRLKGELPFGGTRLPA